MAETFGETMNKQKNNKNRMNELENKEKPSMLNALKALKNKLVASDEDMQKMTENRADVQNRTAQSIGANPAVNKVDLIQDNATGLREPINHVTTDQALSGDTPTPVKTDGGSVLGDLVDTGAVADTFTSGMKGGTTEDGTALTTEEKREAAGLGPENFGLGEKANVTGETGNAGGAGETGDDGNTSQEQIAEDSAMKQWQIAQKVLDEQNPYKSGADYLKALWGNGAKGKSQAVANVLGNILGAVGMGVAGKDYTSDWQRYKDEYTKQSQERRAEAAKNAQDMVNTVAQNKEARAELVNALNQAIAQGANITPTAMTAIQNWQTATQPSSALNKAIASLVQSLQNQGFLGTAEGLLTGFKK